MKVSKFIENKDEGASMFEKPEGLCDNQAKVANANSDTLIPGSANEIHYCPECGGPVEHESDSKERVHTGSAEQMVGSSIRDR